MPYTSALGAFWMKRKHWLTCNVITERPVLTSITAALTNTAAIVSPQPKHNIRGFGPTHGYGLFGAKSMVTMSDSQGVRNTTRCV